MVGEKIKFRSIEDLKDQALNQKLAEKEFNNPIPIDRFLGNSLIMKESSTNRRDFLKILGFSTAAVTLAACEAPIIKSIPYLVNPENGITTSIPGIAEYYATTFYTGYDFASVLVKTREGRPIKIQPNKDAILFGNTNSRAQASILSLYDNDKLKEPKIKRSNIFASTDWDTIDEWILKGLDHANQEKKKIIILTSSLPSPSTKKIICDFKFKYPTTEHIIYDTISYSHALDASEKVFGKRALPMYDLSKAKIIVSFQADFLNDWNGGHMENAYIQAKKPGKHMLKHIQIESNLSVTGANADVRIPLKPSKVVELLTSVYEALEGISTTKQANEIANYLKSAGDNSVVLVDGNTDEYIIGHLINQKLNSKVVVKDQVLLVKESNDQLFEKTLNEINEGKVGVLINFNTNPVYSYYRSQQVKSAFSKIRYSISLVEKEHETTQFTQAIAPIPNGLESWGDYQFSSNIYSLAQPTIQKIYSTRSFQDSLLKWMKSSKDYYSILKEFWTNSILPKLGYSFEQALFNGINVSQEIDSLNYVGGNAFEAIANIRKKNHVTTELNWELHLYTKTSIGDGSLANNPWLQELPDPISRTSWDNYLTVNPIDAEKLNVENIFDGKMAIDGSIVNLELNQISLKNVPVFIQPGQAVGSVGLALGYGQKGLGKVADLGVNAFPFMLNGNKFQLNVKIEKTNQMHEFACIQMQNTLMGRYEIAREVSNFDFINKPSIEWNEPLTLHSYTRKMPINQVDLWDEHDSSDGPKFNLSVDMNACIGCGSCVVACQAENNIPVVGKEEIRRSRDMYWLRIDRYYSSTEKIRLQDSTHDELNEKEQYERLIKPAMKNPDVIFQPVMCQHCNHAPCETVCPVAATSHGKQGQNQMAYNRCVGTRYCANNCPYKVRRFNWFNYSNNEKFDYHMNNDLGRMVLNPDVVTRSRGVMEKCSMCIQMTQQTILEAKKDQRKIKDGELQTACTQVCSTGALQFGDINDPTSKVAELINDPRKYLLLEEVGTKPNVFYHYKVRNK